MSICNSSFQRFVSRVRLSVSDVIVVTALDSCAALLLLTVKFSRKLFENCTLFRAWERYGSGVCRQR